MSLLQHAAKTSWSKASMDTSCYFAAVTGQPFHSTKEYYDLICNPKTSAALLQLALFTSKSSNCGNTAAQQHVKPQQQQGIARSLANQAVEVVSSENKQPQRELHDVSEFQLITSKEPSDVNPQSTNAAAAAAPAAAGATGSVGPSADMPAAETATLKDTPAKIDNADYPVLTGSLLDFSIWNCQPVAAAAAMALHPAGVNSCSGAAAAAATYNEPGWLQDLHAMKAEALQHL